LDWKAVKPSRQSPIKNAKPRISCGLTITKLVHKILGMRSVKELKSGSEDSTDRELRLLAEVEADPETNQRSLSQRAGIALGITNLLLRNLAEKGYLRISQAGWRRWVYSLTPAGVSRKFQLTAAYVHRVLGQYQKVRQMVRTEIGSLGLHRESRIAIYGTGELAELVYLALREMNIEEVDFYSGGSPNGRRFLGMRVNDISTLHPDEYDLFLVGSMDALESSYAILAQRGVTSEKMIALFTDHREEGSR
jgi:DNA-binding MarR family transcriptional regulator